MTILDQNTPAEHLRNAPAAPAVPAHGRLRPLGGDNVTITDGFWAERQHINGAQTLPHIEHWLEREGWLGNFDLAAAGTLPEGRRGREFADSEIYKYLEALAWEIGRTGDETLEARYRRIVDRVAAAQEPDGYLNTMFGHDSEHPRWSDLEWGHELYCGGHLFQAAVARARTNAAADDGLLRIATRFADLICDVFADGADERVCGHPEIETGLVELARVTGNDRYRQQAKRFIDRRGTGTLRDIEWGRSYYQDDIPIRDATALRGHAVRANYLAAGAADIAADTDDAPLLDALRTQWNNTVRARTYLTGGQGAHHQDEAFGDDYELPPDRAYSETCAGIGSIQFSWRMLLHDGDSKYADLIERTLFNVVATSPSADGTAFYYSNTLQRRTPGAPADPDHASLRAEASLRAPWFEVSCCPPNVARTLASLDAYLATTDGRGIQLHQYASARIDTTVDDGEAISLSVTTRYPVDGEVRIIILTDATRSWPLTLRVPAWATDATITVTGADPITNQPAPPGTITIARAFRSGDEVVLNLPLRPRLTAPNARIDAVRGSVAVEYGPTVLALESTDLGGADVADAILDPNTPLQVRADGRVTANVALRQHIDQPWPYGSDLPVDAGPAGSAPLIPYRDWAERGPSTMRIWIPTI